MSRRTDPNSQYKVAIHAINGYRYASTQPFQVDPETGKKVYRRVHWGTVDAPEMNAFNGDPKSLNGRVVNPERIRVVAPGEAFVLKK